MPYFSEVGQHHFAPLYVGGETSFTDTSSGRSFSLLIVVGDNVGKGPLTVTVECAQPLANDPSQPDPATWTTLTRQDGCDSNATPQNVEFTVLDPDHQNRVIELGLDLCGCRFIRAVVSATTRTDVAVLGMFGYLRNTEPAA